MLQRKKQEQFLYFYIQFCTKKVNPLCTKFIYEKYVYLHRKFHYSIVHTVDLSYNDVNKSIINLNNKHGVLQ